MIHKTNGIVLRTVKYGETSIITTVYTELFGIQGYLVKGVRQSSKKSQDKAGYFQPASILEMEVYHNEQKQLQFIKECRWACLYERVLFDVVRNAVAMYIIELLQHSLKQPEANVELFYMAVETLQQTDKAEDTVVANIPLYFTLHLGAELGFQIQGMYSPNTPVLDLKEGFFISGTPLHTYYLENELAAIASKVLSIQNYQQVTTIALNRSTRRLLLQAFQTYMALHIPDFGEIRSYAVMQEVLS